MILLSVLLRVCPASFYVGATRFSAGTSRYLSGDVKQFQPPDVLTVAFTLFSKHYILMG